MTGGGSGIGEYIVAGFAAQGAQTVFFDIDDGAAGQLPERLGGAAQPVRYVRQDLTDLAGTKAAIARLIAEWGALDVLVNNAANDDRHDAQEVTPEYWDERMAVNLRHYFFCSQAVLPAMLAAGRGSVINIGSISWHLALPDLALYQTANAGIEGLTRALARDFGDRGVRVNCVIPGRREDPAPDGAMA